MPHVLQAVVLKRVAAFHGAQRGVAQVVDELIKFVLERLCFELGLAVEKGRPKLCAVAAVIPPQAADISVTLSGFALHRQKQRLLVLRGLLKYILHHSGPRFIYIYRAFVYPSHP